MYSKRVYRTGDRVAVMMKGSPIAGRGAVDILGVPNRRFAGEYYDVEPLIIVEGIVTLAQPPRNPGGRITVNVGYTYNENGATTDDRQAGYQQTAINIDNMHLNSRMERLDTAVRDGKVNEEQYEFFKRFVFPEIVVDHGTHRLLMDLRQAAGLDAVRNAQFPGDRMTLWGKAAQLGIQMRNCAMLDYVEAKLDERAGTAMDNLIAGFTWRGAGGGRRDEPDVVIDGIREYEEEEQL